MKSNFALQGLGVLFKNYKRFNVKIVLKCTFWLMPVEIFFFTLLITVANLLTFTKDFQNFHLEATRTISNFVVILVVVKNEVFVFMS